MNDATATRDVIMLVTKELERAPSGGRELLCKLNYDALREIALGRFVLFELPTKPDGERKNVIGAFRGHIDGLDKQVIERALQTIGTRNVRKVFVDGSNLGAFVDAVTKRYPDVEIITFFHNVEARFFWGSLLQTKKPRALVVLIANYLAEKKSARLSHKVICLSQRDSRLLERIYGREATHVAPMVMQDKLPPRHDAVVASSRDHYALFVGGTFYANRAGIAWFVEKVVPRIAIKICIVGKGFEEFKLELERNGGVEVIGTVDSLSQWYLNSQFVIAPIFDGSGMKTKVAEALMYGKKIIGTPEAFTGYEDIVHKAGRCCSTTQQFVDAMNSFSDSEFEAFDTELREIYQQKYSLEAARARLETIVEQ